MKTVIIGSGNVAYHLAKALKESGIEEMGIYGRNNEELKKIFEEVRIPFYTDDLPEADFYLICVSDNAIAEVSSIIKNPNCLVAHTSGSLPKEELLGNYRKACFYPLQTFSKNKDLNYKDIPFFIEVEHKADENFLLELAARISEKVMLADYERRRHIHLTAVFTCNFVNHLFAKGKEISDSQNIPFDYFLPLIEETVQKIKRVEPKLAQTGPAARHDIKVINAQKALITSRTQLEIYTILTESIMEMYPKISVIA